LNRRNESSVIEAIGPSRSPCARQDLRHSSQRDRAIIVSKSFVPAGRNDNSPGWSWLANAIRGKRQNQFPPPQRGGLNSRNESSIIQASGPSRSPCARQDLRHSSQRDRAIIASKSFVPAGRNDNSPGWSSLANAIRGGAPKPVPSAPAGRIEQARRILNHSGERPVMPSLQDGVAFLGMVSTGFTRGYFHPAPPGRSARALRRQKRDKGHPSRRDGLIIAPDGVRQRTQSGGSAKASSLRPGGAD